MDASPVLEFTAHMDGRNAKVRVYRDRLEWSRQGMMGTGGKLGLAAATGGLSLLATGVKGKNRQSDVVAIRSISGVTTQKHGVGFTDVVVMTMGGSVTLGKLTRSKAEEVQSLLMQLVAAPSSQPVDTTAESPPPPIHQTSVAQELKQLAELRDAGVLSEDEFQAQKAKLLR